LFQIWNYSRFPEEFYINREEVMEFSKIGSKSTYHRCIRELDSWKYLMYKPSHNPFKGSRVLLFQFETSDNQAADFPIPKSGQALVSVTNINKQIINFYKLGQAEKKNEILSFFKKENWPHDDIMKFNTIRRKIVNKYETSQIDFLRREFSGSNKYLLYYEQEASYGRTSIPHPRVSILALSSLRPLTELHIDGAEIVTHPCLNDPEDKIAYVQARSIRLYSFANKKTKDLYTFPDNNICNFLAFVDEHTLIARISRTAASKSNLILIDAETGVTRDVVTLTIGGRSYIVDGGRKFLTELGR
jgi:hypothetical protein